MFSIFPSPKSLKIVTNECHNYKKLCLQNNSIKDLVKSQLTNTFEQCNTDNVFFKNEGSFGSEEYELKIENGVVNITSSDDCGAYYAIQTFCQIAIQNNYNIPNLIIKDKPTYKYRGFMLDCGRYFYTVNEIKHFLDIMALHKLNYFHWHLTEDQGWRIEIKKHPLLTEIGSKRYKTNFFGKSQSGYYTQNDIKEIVKYAHNRFIKVVPEFDIPGHSRAAIAAYENLACFPRELPVATHWGVKHDVLCAGKESTYKFVFEVLDEIIKLFPDKIVHIGSDEVFKHRWELCPDCQKTMKENELGTTNDLQIYFVNKVNEYLKNKGVKSIIWSWDLDYNLKNLDTSVAFNLCNFNNIDDVPKNRILIDTSTSAYYIDLPYGYVSLKDSANHIPPKIENNIGIEAALWTEYVKNVKKAELMMFPRLGAICETAWNGKNSYKEFEPKLRDYYKLLDHFGYSYTLKKRANPKGVQKILSILWFERRQLVWEGLTNIIDDKKIEKIAKRKEDEK